MATIDEDEIDGNTVFRLTVLGVLGPEKYRQIINTMHHFGENAIVLVDERLEWGIVEKAAP